VKLLILRSIDTGTQPDEYSVKMNTAYAERVIGHLTDTGSYCSACGDECINCRSRYSLDFTDSIAGIIDMPAVLPAMLDEPEDFFPAEIPKHDIILALSVHEELLISFITACTGSRAVIVPVEETGWVSPYARKKIGEICEDKGMECAFPKPFCSFAPQTGVLARFREEFRIGRPEIECTVQDGVIEQTRVVSSAPCGATYYVARNLEHKKITEELLYAADLHLSSFPCTSDHSLDPEFNDSITHEAVKIQKQVLAACLQKHLSKCSAAGA